jgi:hypothetical protein
MNGLTQPIAKQCETNFTEAWNLLRDGTTLLEASSILLHLINITMKNYSAMASHFAVFGDPIISMAQPEIDSIPQSQYNEIIAFLDLSKKVSGSFSSMTLTIADAVGETRFLNNSLITSKKNVNLITIDARFHKILMDLSFYKDKVSNDSYSSIYNGLTTLMDQHTQNLVAGRDTIRAAEKILGAALGAQRTLEYAILARL